MLARATAREHRDPDAVAHGVGIVSSGTVSSGKGSVGGGGVVMSGGGTYVPTVTVISELGFASVVAGGSCEMTTPSSDSSSVS